MLIKYHTTLLNFLISSNISKSLDWLMKHHHLHSWITLLRDNIVKGKRFFLFLFFACGLNHWMTSDSGVHIKSIGKAHRAQLDTKFPCLKSPSLPLVCSKFPCHLISLPTLVWFCHNPHETPLVPKHCCHRGGGQVEGIHSVPWDGLIQVDKRSVTETSFMLL